LEGFKYSDVFKAPEFWNESGFGKKVGGLVTELGGHSDVVGGGGPSPPPQSVRLTAVRRIRVTVTFHRVSCRRGHRAPSGGQGE
jgi:hypothetical protein